MSNEDRNGTGERYAYGLCGNRLLKEQYSGSSVDVTEGYHYNERNEQTEHISAGGFTAYRYDREGLRAGLTENRKRCNIRSTVPK